MVITRRLVIIVPHLALLTLAFQTTADDEAAAAPSKKSKSKARVPSGHDAEDYCRTCLYMANELTLSLVPDLQAHAEKLRGLPFAQKNRKAAHYGEVDEIVEQHIERSCQTIGIDNNPLLRRACKHITEEHLETLIGALSKWHAASRPVSELRGILCARGARACKSSALNLVPSISSMSASTKTTYHSTRPPKVNDGPVFIAVGATLNETLNNHTDKDLVMYFHRKDERHTKLQPMVTRLAELLAALPRRPSTLMFASIDAARNELVPPWDQLEQSTVMLFGAGRPPMVIGPGAAGQYREMRTLEWLEPVERTLSETLTQMADSCRDEHAKRHLGNLMVHLGEERMFSGRLPWWQDQLLLVRAKTPYEEDIDRGVEDSSPKDEV